MRNRREFLLGAASALLLAGRGAPPPALSPKLRAKAAFEAFLKAYWHEEKARFRRYKGKDTPLDFWFAAHAWDMLIDADKLFRTQQTKMLVRRYYDSFCRKYPDWTKNEFNDDILWWTIACTNAYSHTHERRYLDQAQNNFLWLVENEMDDTLGGGMWWKNSKHGSKNACDNFPAVITACNLYSLTKQKRYRDTALALYTWSREKFFDTRTGAVYDNVNLEGKLTRWDFTYNVGTFIGSALRLNRIAPVAGATYLEDARKAGRHFLEALSANGIVKPSGQGDGGAFHGVGFRYLFELERVLARSSVRKASDADFKAYLRRNVESAWEHRRPSDNLVGTNWRKVPDETFDIEGQTANSALTAIILAARMQG